MKIERFDAIDRCLFWKENKILIIGDLHLGYENYLNERGWVFPKTQMEETLKIFDAIFKKTGRVKKIVLLGDVKHYFGGILKKEFEDFYKLVEIFKKHLYKSGRIVIVKGNHDNILEPIVNKDKFRGRIFLKDFYDVEGVLFFHGNKRDFEKFQRKIEDKKIKLIVTGHFHPAVKINDGEKQEKFKCFVFGKYKKKKWIIVPSFFPLEAGSDLFGLKGRIFVVADKVYDFGKMK